MGESVNTAVFVSFVGMITVFVILGLVVLTGKTLIRVVNTFIPIEEAQPAPQIAKRSQPPVKSFNKSTLAAIITTIDVITNGRGKVDKIEKIN